MRLVARRLQLNNGQWCALRSPEPSEAAQRMVFLRRANAETDFMARGASDSPADEALVAGIIAASWTTTARWRSPPGWTAA